MKQVEKDPKAQNGQNTKKGDKSQAKGIKLQNGQEWHIGSIENQLRADPGTSISGYYQNGENQQFFGIFCIVVLVHHQWYIETYQCWQYWCWPIQKNIGVGNMGILTIKVT